MTAELSPYTDVSPERWPDVARVPDVPAKARITEAIVRQAVSGLPVRVSFPDGTTWGAGSASAPEMLLVRPREFFSRLAADFRSGFGEAYMAGDWVEGQHTDLADLLSPFAARMASLVPRPLQAFRKLVDTAIPHSTRNTVEGSRDNIQAHYDLSNDLFAEFLDPTMTYSSAWFADEDDDLERAQERKIDGMLDYARVGEGTRVLEIGTGWGALAIRAAARGAQVVTITISHEQAALAQERIDAAGLSDRVEVRLQDYREVTGEFDAILSVEMIEAVGEEYWPTYFSTIDRLLAPNGRVSIQAITMAHDRYLTTRRSYGWIQKYIFPGGLIPSLTAIDEVLAEHTDLYVQERRDLGVHYAETLRQWRARFEERRGAVAQLGFDDVFHKMWRFYLAYCEAGFRTEYIGVSQLAIGRRPSFVG
ncbi:class I SAM-dependent methyltransferase [Solicola sp. PLA-1-18]|uniref:class I SAM-dependent methyltransferase n=1 Tax=Solicola sp. PLA-1-18 TaxID=3380532 RepID=UPI003B7F62B0